MIQAFVVSLLLSLLTTQIPQRSTGTDPWELGTRLTPVSSGRLLAIRYWRLVDDPGPHVGHVWSVTGEQLAAVPFVAETASGWQVQALVVPLPVSAGQPLTVSVNSPAGAHYAVQPGLFTAAMSTSLLIAPASAGVYGASGVYPTASTPTGYFRDALFDLDPLPTIVIGPDPLLPFGVAAQLKGFQPGVYTLGISLQSAAGVVITTSGPLTLPVPIP